jgi:hypothetical protein
MADGRVRAAPMLIVGAAAAFAGWVIYSLVSIEPVKVTASSMRHENGQVFVEGEVENSGPATGPIDIEVRYFDAIGRQVGEERVVMEKLGEGGTGRFITPKRTLDGAQGFSIYLNRGRNPYGN